MIGRIKWQNAKKANSERQASRLSLEGALENIKNIGWAPNTVIDVGAAFGAWSKNCFGIFPDAHYVLIDPLIEYQNFWPVMTKDFHKVDFICGAASPIRGEIELNVHPDWTGSSVLKESEGPHVDGSPRKINTCRIDKICQTYKTKGPYLLKIDTQGYEIEVMKGTTKIMPEVEYIILEVSLHQFFFNGPLAGEILSFMKSHGFVLYDIISLMYRPIDNALSQMDMAFVQENGMFRKINSYATREQREDKNQKFIEWLNNQTIAPC